MVAVHHVLCVWLGREGDICHRRVVSGVLPLATSHCLCVVEVRPLYRGQARAVAHGCLCVCALDVLRVCCHGLP